MTTTDIEYLINDQGLADVADAALQQAPSIERVTASPVRPVHNGFKDFVRGDAYGVSEVAIVTILQAIALERPVIFLPLTALGRYQHQTLISVAPLSVQDLPGRTVGVRSWSQTTGMWVRGILAHQYGIDLSSITWRTYEGGHLEDLADPEWVQHAPADASLAEDLLGGTVDFAIMGNDRPKDPSVRDVIPDAKATAVAWAEEVGFIPVNHVFGARVDVAREAPDAVLGVYDAIAADLERKQGDGQGPSLQPFGFAAMRPALTAAARYGWEQKLLPREVTYDEVVERTTAALGVEPSRLGA